MTASAWSDAAAWVQAVGTICAVIGAAWIAAADARSSREREEHVRSELARREQRERREVKAAARNLAILASTQIEDLNLLLRDEARRGRLAHVSPSRGLMATERLLTSYAVQKLDDAQAMVAFARFPNLLASAEEICANLEVAIRAAEEPAHADLFADYADQMARLGEIAKQRLAELEQVLDLEEINEPNTT